MSEKRSPCISYLECKNENKGGRGNDMQEGRWKVQNKHTYRKSSDQNFPAEMPNVLEGRNINTDVMYEADPGCRM